MGIVIREAVFSAEAEDRFIRFSPEEANAAQLPDSSAIVIANDIDIDVLLPVLSDLKEIAIEFPSFGDGRGYSIAQQLRLNGFAGRLRARGHILADQYPLALRCGFDEVEISEAQAERMPVTQWRDAVSRVENNYQDRLLTLA